MNGIVTPRHVQARYIMGAGAGNVLAPIRIANSGAMFQAPDRQRIMASGKLFLAGTSLSFGGSLSSDQFVVRLNNPADSGKDIWVGSVFINTDVGQEFRFIRNADLNSPNTIVNPSRNLNFAFPDTTVITLEADTTEPDTGDDWPGRFRVSGGVGQLELSNGDGAPIVVLPPGNSIVIAGSSSAAQNTGVQVTYAELDTIYG